MRYLEISLRCRRMAVEVVSDLLIALAGGVSVEDPLDVEAARDRGWWDIVDLPPGDPEWVVLRAYLADTDELTTKRSAFAAGLAEIGGWAGAGAWADPVERWVSEEDWANAWKAYYRPLPVGRRLLIVPAWEQDQQHTGATGRLPVILDPGMAFGTGQHATTALCLAWLEELVAPGMACLDVGTGSGILAIAAARLGAGPVLGFDPDPVAVQVAGQNIDLNGLAGAIAVTQGELATAPVQDWITQHRPQLVVANLVAGLIMQLAAELAGALPGGGQLLASGVIAEKQADVTAALARAGLQVREVREAGGWVALLAERA